MEAGTTLSRDVFLTSGGRVETSETARLVVRDELLALRKSPGVLSPTKLATAYTTCFYLCGGDPEQSLDLLHGFYARFDDREIQAAIRSLGLVETDNHTSVLSRLNSIADDLFLEQRHVRRLSDIGITRLAGLIVDSMLGANAWVDAYVSEDNDDLLVQLRYKTPPNVALNLTAEIAGTDVDTRSFDTEQGDSYITRTSKAWRVEPVEDELRLLTLTVRSTAQVFFTASSIVTGWRTRVITSRMTMTIDLWRR